MVSKLHKPWLTFKKFERGLAVALVSILRTLVMWNVKGVGCLSGGRIVDVPFPLRPERM